MGMTGGCLCGEVTFEAAAPKPNVSACHCEMCRRWCSGPFFGVDCGTEVTFEGEENIGVIASSDWAERGFCAICGSNLYYRLIDSGQYQMAAGAFDDPSGFVLKLQVFTDEAQEFCALAPESRMMTGAEVFAMFAPSADKGE